MPKKLSVTMPETMAPMGVDSLKGAEKDSNSLPGDGGGKGQEVKKMSSDNAGAMSSKSFGNGVDKTEMNMNTVPKGKFSKNPL